MERRDGHPGIQGLPLEILVKILACVMAITMPDTEGGGPFRVLVPPQLDSQYLILMQVCRRWRAVIINSPIFWVRYRLEATGRLNEGRPENQTSLSLTKEWISRGRDCPKDLVVLDHWSETVADANHLLASSLPMIDNILHVIAERVCKLHFSGLDVPGWNSLLMLPPASFPLLEDFSIRCTFLDRAYASQKSANPVFLNAPLRFVSIHADDLSLKFDIADLGFSYNRLRTLKLSSNNWEIGLNRLCEILKQCGCLETLNIGMNITLDDLDASEDLQIVTLPHCREFSMTPSFFTHAYWRLGQLVELPSLELFSIDCFRGIPQVPWQFTWYNRLLSPSIDRLKTLLLPQYSAPPVIPELIHILHGATKLESLGLGNCGPRVVDILGRILRGALCPLLTDLSIIDKRITYEIVVAVHELYISPTRPAIPLRKVWFVDRSGHGEFVDLKKRARNMLDGLREAGLDVELFKQGGFWDEVNWA